MLGTLIFFLFFILFYLFAWLGRKWVKNNNLHFSVFSIIGMCVLLFCLMMAVLVAPNIYGHINTKAAIFKYAEQHKKVVVSFFLCDDKGNRLDQRSREAALNGIFMIIWRYRVTFGKNEDKILTIGLPLLGQFFGDVTAVHNPGEG
jgi:amino acid transporter